MLCGTILFSFDHLFSAKHWGYSYENVLHLPLRILSGETVHVGMKSFITWII